MSNDLEFIRSGYAELTEIFGDKGAAIGTSAVISEVNWLVVASASVLAGILSLLTSVAGLPEVNE